MNPNHGKNEGIPIGHLHKTVLDQLKYNVDISDMTNAIKNRNVWKIIVTNARATHSTQKVTN